MKIQINMNSFTDFTLGFTGCQGEDVEGNQFNMLSFGFLIFNIDIVIYEN
jgi:hypothetical protein